MPEVSILCHSLVLSVNLFDYRICLPYGVSLKSEKMCKIDDEKIAFWYKITSQVIRAIECIKSSDKSY